MKFLCRIDAVLQLGMLRPWEQCDFEIIRYGSDWMIERKKRMTQFRT